MLLKNEFREHPLIYVYDEAVLALERAWDRFNNCSPDEVEAAVLELELAEGRVDRVIREAREWGIRANTIKSRVLDVRSPFWLKYFVFRNPEKRERRTV